MTDHPERITKYNGIINVAVVDDHHLFRAGLVSLLKDYEELNVVMQASGGKDLLKQLKNYSESGKPRYSLPDVVLLDIQMQEMNGVETTLRLQQDYPGIKIIILTMHNEEGFIFDLMNKGASGFLAKDKTVDMVVEAIHSVMDTGIYFNAQILQAIVKGSQLKLKTPEFSKGTELSEREIEIIRLVCDQKTNKEIAEILEVSQRTIETHRTTIANKTGVKNTAGLVLFAITHKLIRTF